MRLRQSLKVAGVGMALFGLMAVPSLGRVSAQEATPEPIDLVEQPAPCGEWLGIGDATVACVLILHLAPDAPAVDVWLDGAVAVQALEFGKDTGYVAVPAGDHIVDIAQAGADATAAIWSDTITLEAGMAYHAAAMGTLATDDEVDFGVSLFERTVGSWAEGASIVEVIHASPDTPGVDIAPKGAAPIIVDLTYGEVSDDLALPAGVYDLAVSPSGTSIVALELTGAELEAGHIYTIYGIGTLAAGDDVALAAYIVVTHPED